MNLAAEIIRYYSKSDADAMLLFEFLDDKFKNGSTDGHSNITAPIELGKVFTFGGTKVRFEKNTIGLGGADKAGVFIHFLE